MANETNAVEKIEAQNKLEQVQKADAKVLEIKEQKLAEKARKHEERLKKHPKLGSVINWMDDHKVTIVVGALTGGVGFAGGWIAHKALKKADEPITPVVDLNDDETEVVEEETPFEG